MEKTMHNHGYRPMAKDELQHRYDDLALEYNRGRWVEDYLFGVKRIRAKLLAQASGKVLDVACGTGENFPFFKTNTTVIAIDLSSRMLDIARGRAESLRLSAVEFPDKTFGTVVSALSTCTFPDPVTALREFECGRYFSFASSCLL